MFKPFGNNVIVKADLPATTTKSGLYIPETALDYIITGVVQAVGKGSKDHVPEAQVNDHIIFDKNRAIEITNGEDKFFVIADTDILASF